MSDPKRWLDDCAGSTGLERKLLGSALDVEPPKEAHGRVWAAIAGKILPPVAGGLLGGAAGAAAGAAGSGAAGASGSAAGATASGAAGAGAGAGAAAAASAPVAGASLAGAATASVPAASAAGATAASASVAAGATAASASVAAGATAAGIGGVKLAIVAVALGGAGVATYAGVGQHETPRTTDAVAFVAPPSASPSSSAAARGAPTALRGDTPHPGSASSQPEPSAQASAELGGDTPHPGPEPEAAPIATALPSAKPTTSAKAVTKLDGDARAAAAAAASAERDARHQEERTVLRDARDAYRGGNPRRALELLDDAAKRFPDGLMGQEREKLTIEALAASGDRAAARRRAEAFLKLFPKSPFASSVQPYLE